MRSSVGSFRRIRYEKHDIGNVGRQGLRTPRSRWETVGYGYARLRMRLRKTYRSPAFGQKKNLGAR
jgi:hypothetical protein